MKLLDLKIIIDRILEDTPLSVDCDVVVRIYGENLQDGVAGFGKSPCKAFEDFDRNWQKEL